MRHRSRQIGPRTPPVCPPAHDRDRAGPTARDRATNSAARTTARDRLDCAAGAPGWLVVVRRRASKSRCLKCRRYDEVSRQARSCSCRPEGARACALAFAYRRHERDRGGAACPDRAEAERRGRQMPELDSRAPARRAPLAEPQWSWHALRLLCDPRESSGRRPAAGPSMPRPFGATRRPRSEMKRATTTQRNEARDAVGRRCVSTSWHRCAHALRFHRGAPRCDHRAYSRDDREPHGTSPDGSRGCAWRTAVP